MNKSRLPHKKPIAKWFKRHLGWLLVGFILPSLAMLFIIFMYIHESALECHANWCYEDSPGHGLEFILLLMFLMMSWAWQAVAWLAFLMLSLVSVPKRRILRQHYHNTTLILLGYLLIFPILMWGVYWLLDTFVLAPIIAIQAD